MSTKKLAKELGLLRQRSQSSNGLKKPLLTNQIFAYLIVIDFESTCWREKNNYTQEIIEFPAVLLNTSTGDVESEFHTYVQPQEHPVLSEFCTELTGITQMQVEAGIPLQICLSRFSRWLQNLHLNMGVVFPNRQQTSNASSASQKLCTFLTWSDWDLGVCLQYECKRKQLHKPEVLNSWIDLRSTYRLFYDRKPKGLNGALQDLGIQFSGREHSGLDDSRNTAQLAARMMRDGCVMKITRSLVTSPSMVKPKFGNTATDNQKEKSNTAKEENTRTTNKPSLSPLIPPKSCQIKLCTEVMMRDLGPKENSSSAQESVQSLISPVTLLNGTTMPLWGNSRRSVTAETAANISSLVMRNCASPHINNNNNNNNNNSSLVLCSTTVDCLSNQSKTNQPAKTDVAVGLVEEEDGAELLVETEDRCSSYDNVVLESGDEGEVYVSEVDSGRHVREEPDNTHSPGGQVTFRNNMRLANNFETEKMLSESAMSFSAKKMASLLVPSISNSSIVISKPSTTSEHSTHFADPNPTMSFSAKKLASLVNMSNSSIVIRKPSAMSEPSSHFAVPKTVTGPKSKQHEPHKNSKTDTPFLFRHKLSMPEKTSTPISSFFRSKPLVTQQANKDTPKSSFTVFTDSAKPSSRGSFCISKNVLSSLSTNTFSSCTTRSSISVTMKGQRITSPLCACGRRAKRQVVSNGGPNHGRGFYCCPVRRSGSGGKIQKGCEFFKWESALMKSSVASPAAVGSSVSLCHINSTMSCRPPQKSMIRKSY